MNIYILRHGIAVEHGAPGYKNDALRPLTPKGERKVWIVAEAMEKMKIVPDRILSSPLVRAKQTAEIAAEALGLAKHLRFTDTLITGAPFEKLIRFVNALHPSPKHLMLVGHEPHLSQLISLLVAGDSGMAIRMKKAGLAKLTVEKLRAERCATLEWLLTPAQMAVMV
jgi:phosphohistidine phosphatase